MIGCWKWQTKCPTIHLVISKDPVFVVRLTTHFCIVQDNTWSYGQSTRTRSIHALKFRQIPTPSDYHKFSFSQGLFVTGIYYQPVWLKLPVWYHSEWSCHLCQYKLSGPVMSVAQVRSLTLCMLGNFACFFGVCGFFFKLI